MVTTMEPLTEHRGVRGPVVYGFLRLVRVSAARQEALHGSLAEYCLQHELTLSGVFTERTADTDGSAAFTGLLDVLELPDVYGVVVPAVSHLGPKAIAVARKARITVAGARLLAIRRPRDGRPAGSGPAGGPSEHVRSRCGPAPTLDTDT